MKRRTKVVLGLGTVGLIGLAGWAAVKLPGRSDRVEDVATVTVQRGDVVEKAVAVGTIEPRAEVEVKSKVSGVVRHQFAEAGDFVRAGTALLDIRPDPTPLELVDARRQLEMREMELDAAARELLRQQPLQQAGVITEMELERAARRHAEAKLQVTAARERLALLEDGRVLIEGRVLESMVHAPVDGYILERMVQVGDPVVPLSTYQAGTALFRMADMQDLVFRGTVDEIDVGRIEEGMEVLIRIGALPDRQLRGTVARIALKGRRQDQGTVFPVEVTVTDMDGAALRAGYSANAEIIVRRAENALLLPERVISFAGDTATVTVQMEGGATERRTIEIGVSDAINIEVTAGLREGERVVERGITSPPRNAAAGAAAGR